MSEKALNTGENMSDHETLGHDSLRQLLALRDAGTPGDWHIERGIMAKSLWITCWWREQRMRGTEAEGPIASVSTERYLTDDLSDSRLRKVPIKKAEDDAKLIVAAVNALPEFLARIAALESVAKQCGDQFQFYANEHTAAGKTEKAATNQRFADLARAALTLKENDDVES